MKIVIVGQGAIGLLWYHKLSQHPDNQVALLCSADTKNIPDSLSFTNAKGTVLTKINHIQKEQLKQADIVLFCLKAYSFQQAFDDYLPFINKSTPIILCHNGMLAEEDLPKNKLLLSLLTTHASKKDNAFSITHTGLGSCDLGLLQGGTSQAQCQLITEALHQALPETCWYDDIKQKQWRKLAINCVINPLTAINNCDNGALTAPEYQEQIQAILKEFILVAKHFEQDFQLEELKALVLSVAKSTAKNCSSMRSDILNHRKTEIAHINGFIVQAAKRLNIPAPENTKLTQVIIALEQQN